MKSAEERCRFIMLTNFNKTLTLKEAKELYNNKTGMQYPDTTHNRKIMKSLVEETLNKLRGD